MLRGILVSEEDKRRQRNARMPVIDDITRLNLSDYEDTTLAFVM